MATSLPHSFHLYAAIQKLSDDIVQQKTVRSLTEAVRPLKNPGRRGLQNSRGLERSGRKDHAAAFAEADPLGALGLAEAAKDDLGHEPLSGGSAQGPRPDTPPLESFSF